MPLDIKKICSDIALAEGWRNENGYWFNEELDKTRPIDHDGIFAQPPDYFLSFEDAARALDIIVCRGSLQTVYMWELNTRLSLNSRSEIEKVWLVHNCRLRERVLALHTIVESLNARKSKQSAG